MDICFQITVRSDISQDSESATVISHDNACSRSSRTAAECGDHSVPIEPWSLPPSFKSYYCYSESSLYYTDGEHCHGSYSTKYSVSLSEAQQCGYLCQRIDLSNRHFRFTSDPQEVGEQDETIYAETSPRSSELCNPIWPSNRKLDINFDQTYSVFFLVSDSTPPGAIHRLDR